MLHVDLARTVSERHGLSLAEFAVLDVVTSFSVTEQEVAKFAGKLLQDSGLADVSCEAAVQSCLDRGLIDISSGCRLKLTQQGSLVKDQILAEVCVT